jgi:hypothetical protein
MVILSLSVCLSSISLSLSLSLNMAVTRLKTVSRRSPTADARPPLEAHKQVRGTLTLSPTPQYYSFPDPVSQHNCSALIFVHTLLLAGQTGGAWEAFKTMFLRSSCSASIFESLKQARSP